MLLSDTAVRQVKPRDKGFTMKDGGGLALFVSPSGGKSWHFRFMWNGKQLRISFGTYPEVTLQHARRLRDQARELVAQGMDPRHHLKPDADQSDQAKGLSFADVANEWHEFKCGRWSTDSPKGSAYQSRRVLDKDILPYLGSKPFVGVARIDVVTAIKRIETRGALGIAEKARSWVRQIFEFGIASGYRDNNPATGIEAIAAEQPPVRHNPILTKGGSDLKHLLLGVTTYSGSIVTQCALWTMLYTGVRTIELRRAAPDDFNFEQMIWRIPPTAVKQLRGRVTKDGKEIKDYVVPLPEQLLPHIRRLFDFTGRRYKHAFPGRNNPDSMISENTLNQAIKRIGLGGRLTGHGVRGTLSTALYEMGYPEHLVESQLSHADPNKSRAAYDHSEFVEERRIMMQAWADYLGSLLQTIRYPFDHV